MTLLDLRRYAVRNRVRIHFTVDPAGECVMNEHGVLTIPSMRAVPSFNVEDLLGSVEQFTVADRKLSRQQLQSLLGEAPKAYKAHED